MRGIKKKHDDFWGNKRSFSFLEHTQWKKKHDSVYLSINKPVKLMFATSVEMEGNNCVKTKTSHNMPIFMGLR